MPRLVLRAGMTPLPIKLAAALGLAVQVTAARERIPSLKVFEQQLTSAPFIWALAAAISLWIVVATLRLSRWPLVVLTVGFLAGLAWLLFNFAIGVGSGLFGVASAAFATWLFQLVLVGPYWRRLNWRPFGHIPGAREAAEAFS
ncbi:hypothetical protein ACO2Q3_08410 [Caulobacter sp. KR2-114]|uniref:hypothetical protein n=1 Tax=Caulobacter sp. KR2-114 TaxID=3400912 RepID=UPI003BFE256D